MEWEHDSRKVDEVLKHSVEMANLGEIVNRQGTYVSMDEYKVNVEMSHNIDVVSAGHRG